MKKEKLLFKLLAGKSDANFDLSDLANLLLWLGFEERRGSGSHRIFIKHGCTGIINLQATGDGKAKTYQVKQVRNFILEYKLAEL